MCIAASSYHCSLFNKHCSGIVGEYGTKPLYRMLGYFSVIGLLRVHSLLGDFTLALKVMEHVELNQKVRDTAHCWVAKLTLTSPPSLALQHAM